MKLIEKIIKVSLDELAKIANEKDREKSKKGQTSKLIFPKYRSDTVRISEQEARLLFIRELEKEKDEFYYSIETPTSDLYKFSDKEYKKSENNNEKYQPKKGEGQSASFDLTIYNGKFEREHFVEFKNENVDTVTKDFLKLLCDKEEKENYFVHIIKNKNSSSKSIIGKYQKAVDYIEEKKYPIISRLKIVLFYIETNKKIWFKEISKNNKTIEEK